MIHILVVDDDEKLNKTVCTWLNDGEFEAKGVLNANDAFDELYNNLYDLIISDIMMPEVDGFRFCIGGWWQRGLQYLPEERLEKHMRNRCISLQMQRNG